MSAVLQAAGVQLPLEDAGGRPLVATAVDADAAPLGWVLNGAVTGALPGLRDAVAAGDDAVVQGLFAARPDPTADHTAAAAAWRRLGGADPGADAYLVGATFLDTDLLLPRGALLELLDALEAARAPGAAAEPVGLDELERRADELESLGAAHPEAAAKRRFLIAGLDAAGVLGDRPPAGVDERPLLAGYRDAAAELQRYLASDERRALVADAASPAVVGAPVSLDWFRRPSPRPDASEHPFHWLAAGEATLRAAPLDARALVGEVFLRRAGGWWLFDWRRDDGATPALVASRPVAP